MKKLLRKKMPIYSIYLSMYYIFLDLLLNQIQTKTRKYKEYCDCSISNNNNIVHNIILPISDSNFPQIPIYSRVHNRWNEVFFKILKKLGVVQKKLYLI